jgi:hypothetical protein
MNAIAIDTANGCRIAGSIAKGARMDYVSERREEKRREEKRREEKRLSMFECSLPIAERAEKSKSGFGRAAIE